MQPQDYAYLYELEENFWWFVGMRQITRTLLDPILPLSTDRRVLDAGCGTGDMMSWLARYANNGPVMGVDLSPAALGFSRQRGHRNLAQSSIVELPFADSTFDLVTSFDVIQHVPLTQDARAIAEIHRVLRVGGIAFMRTSAYQWLRSGHDDALAVQQRYRRSQLADLMQGAGFRIRRATYANTLLLPIAILKRLVFFSGAGSDVKPWPNGFHWMNSLLTVPLVIEARAINKMDFPSGLSAICIGEKPPG
jgi:ubiquinone/menaquinone biosynthesis C-methylase UbiE